MAYLYETHLHTAPVSKCAVSGGADYIAGYKDLGYTGIMVTDHFYNANCGLDRNLEWKDWVNEFYRGYEEAKEEGDKRGLDVFFGWEETFDGRDDYLIYGLDKQWLLEHPEVRHWSRGEQYAAVKKAGGCVVQAHPFREREYISRIVLSAGCVDAVEVANVGNNNNKTFDALALRYAKKINKPMTAGTDIHDAKSITYEGVLGVYLDKKLTSIADYVKIVCNNEIAGLKVDESRFVFHGTESVSLPVDIRDEEDKITGKSWKEVI
ncbi:MAG: histidinol-phosphatase [Treponema sp.]|jgi:hypothetical protein|nr:histidinol-phosphatase [Treponema sp.]